MTATLTSIVASSTFNDNNLTTPTPTIYGPFHTIPDASGAQAVNRSSIAALAFLLWDILITFDEEVKFIWPRDWSYIKFIYFFVRYIPIMVEASIICIGTELTPQFHFTQRDCWIWQIYQGMAMTLIIVVVDIILILRVYALYQHSKLVHNIIRCGFVVEIIGMILGMVLAVPNIETDDVCLVTHAPRSMTVWAVSLVFQTLLFVLTSYRFYTTFKSGWRDIPLLLLLMRDGTWAFFLLFFIFCGYAVLLVIPHHSYAGVLFGWLLAAFSFAGYRIILNLNGYSRSQTPVISNPPIHPTDTQILFISRSRQSGGEIYELNKLTQSSSSRSRGEVSGLTNISDLQLEP